MATARAIASGNWSATGTWNGGVLPGNGDTVYANGFTVTINQNINIGGANNPIVNAGSFVSGQWYEITSVGSTSFTAIGAAANTVGTIFQASGVGSGTGQAGARATLTTAANTPAGATTGGGGFAMSTSYTMPCDLRAGTSGCLTVTGAAGFTLESAQVIAGPNANTPVITCSGSGSITINNSVFRNLGAGVVQNVVLNTGSATFTINAADCVMVNGGNCFSNTSTGNFVFNNSTFTAGANSAICVAHSAASNATSTFNSCTLSQVNTGNVVVSNSGGGNLAFNNSTISAIGNQAAINNTGTGVVSANGSVFTGGVSAALNNGAIGTIVLTACTVTASNTIAGIISTGTNNRFSGILIAAQNGMQPISATRWWLGASPTVSYIQHALDGTNANSFVRFFTGDNSTALNQASPIDVRSGVAYGIGNSQTGRLTVPARGSVALSVNYGPSMPFTATRSGTTATATLAYSYPLVVGDEFTVTGASNSEWNSTYTIASVVSGTSVTFTVPNTHSAAAGTGALMQTTGTAVLDPAAVASAVWGAATRTLTTSSGPTAVEIRQEMDSNSTKLANLDATVSSRLAPSGTLATVTTLTNAPASVTPEQIRIEMDANSTKLANLDATVSSRLATSGYTAPSAAPTAAQNATAVWAAATKEITGGTITTLTNAPTVPTASAIASQVRTELATELARVDVATSTRLAGSAYTAPSNSDVTAIKAKTDLLETTRLAQCSTVATTGAQLAAALS
jgi:hypothetical protein